VGDTVGVAVGKAATFALLLVRFVGSATHPVAIMPANTRSADPKYRFILCILLSIKQFHFAMGVPWMKFSLRLGFFSATLPKPSRAKTTLPQGRREIDGSVDDWESAMHCAQSIRDLGR